MNKRKEKIRKLTQRGIYDPKVIAQKLGYKGGALTHAISEIEKIQGELLKEDTNKWGLLSK